MREKKWLQKKDPRLFEATFSGEAKKKIVDLFQFKRIKQKCRFLYRFLSKAHLGFKKKYQQTLIKITHAIVSIRYRRMVIS